VDARRDGAGVAGDDRESPRNDDLSLRARVDTAELPWAGSPADGVWRRRLELGGGPRPRLTTVVRFAPGSAFPEHVHDGGEEYLVLDGTFSDERGDYPAGSYVRNPPGSRHAPSSRDGCELFVKLRQFAPGDEGEVVVRPAARRWRSLAAGLRQCPLHAFGDERVALLAWDTAATWRTGPDDGGIELLVLAGPIETGGEILATGSWLRCPAGEAPELAATGGALAWIKHGHLRW
jgi:quercetin dioxygenase-like cupin family protein